MYRMVGRAHVHCDTEEARSNMSNYPHNGSTMSLAAHWQHNAAIPVISQEIRPSFPSHQVLGKNMLISMP